MVLLQALVVGRGARRRRASGLADASTSCATRTPTASLVVAVALARRRRRRVRALLGHEPGRRLAAGAVPRRRAAVRLRRPGARDPRRVPRLSGDQHDHASASRTRIRQGFVGLDNYRFVFTDESMLAVDAEHVALDRARPARRGQRRARVRDPGRPAAARRGGREVADLPADGDLVRRRGGHVPAHLQLPARGVRHEHRAAERHQVRARAATGGVALAASRGTTCSSW